MEEGGGAMCTVWKFQDFCITVILREINFEDSRSAKSTVFAILGAPNFVKLVTFSLQKVKKFITIKIQSPKNDKNGSFITSTFSKTDFT